MTHNDFWAGKIPESILIIKLKGYCCVHPLDTIGQRNLRA